MRECVCVCARVYVHVCSAVYCRRLYSYDLLWPFVLLGTLARTLSLATSEGISMADADSYTLQDI